MNLQEITPAISARIKIARVLCILMLVYVHVPPWFPPGLADGRAPDAFDIFFAFVNEAVSRTSVPLLSVISGYLLMMPDTAGKAISQGRRIAKKVPSLIIPLLLWNAIAVTLNFALGRLDPATPLEWINRFTALASSPMITPLYFLRDIFLCVLLFPLIRLALRRASRYTLIALAAMSIFGLTAFLFINPFILLFFAFGCGVANGVFGEPKIGFWPVVALSIIIACVVTALHLQQFRGLLPDDYWTRTGLAALVMVQRASGALLFWKITAWLLERRAGALAQRIEPHIFFFFCAHTLVLGLLWRAVSTLGFDYGTAGYAIFYIAAPIWALIPVLAATAILLAISPPVLRMLCGGRLPRALFRLRGNGVAM